MWALLSVFASKEELKKYTLDFKLESGMEIVLADDGKAYKAGEEIADSSENQQWWKIQHQEMTAQPGGSDLEITLIREAMQV